MKLRLPSGLRTALLTCISGLAAVGTTIGTGAVVAAAFSGNTLAANVVPGVNEWGDIWLTTETDVRTEDEGKDLLIHSDYDRIQLNVAEATTVGVDIGAWSSDTKTYIKAGLGTLTVTGVGQVVSNFTDGAHSAGTPKAAIVNEGTLNVTFGGGNGFVTGTASVNAGATLQLHAVDALGYKNNNNNNNYVDTVTLTGEPGKLATLQVDYRQTLSTAIVLMGNSQVTVGTGEGIGTGGDVPMLQAHDNGSISATGVNNTITAPIKLSKRIAISVTDAETAAEGDVNGLTISGLFSGTGTVTKSGTGTLTLTGGNSTTSSVMGGLTISEGTVVNTGTLQINDSLSIASGAALNNTGTLIVAGNYTSSEGITVVSGATLQIGNNKEHTNSFRVPSITVAEGATLGIFHAVDTEGNQGAFEYADGQHTDINLAGKLYGHNTSPNQPDATHQSLKFGNLTIQGNAASLEGDVNARLQFKALTGEGMLTVKPYTGTSNSNKWHRYTHTFDTLQDFQGSLIVEGTTTDEEGNVSKVYINSVNQADGKSATITGKTYSAEGFVMGSATGTAMGSVAFDDHTAEGSMLVESGTMTVKALTLAEGASLELARGTLALGTLASSGTTAPEIKLLGGTFGAADASNGFSTNLAVTLGAVTLGSETLTGAITFGGAVTFVDAAINAGTLHLTSTSINVTSDGLAALTHSGAASTTYSEGANGYVNGTYTLIAGAEGSYLDFGEGITEKAITVAGANSTLTAVGGSATFTLMGTSGTYYVNESMAYNQTDKEPGEQIAGADDIYVAENQTLTFNNKNWNKNIDLAGASLVFNIGSMNDMAATVKPLVTLHSDDTNGDGIYQANELSSNSISAQNTTMTHTVTGAGNLKLVKLDGDVFIVNGTFEHVGNLTLCSGLTIQDNAFFNNEGTLRLEGYTVGAERVGSNITGFELVNSSLTLGGTQAANADLTHVSADADSTLSVVLNGTAGTPGSGHTVVSLADDFAGTLDVKAGQLKSTSALGNATVDLSGGSLVFDKPATVLTRQEFTNDIVIDADTTAYVTTFGDDSNTGENFVTGAITGEGTLIKNDGGRATLENISGFTGNLQANGGMLTLNLGEATFDATRVSFNGGEVKLKGSGTYEVSGATEVENHAERLNVTTDWTGTVKLAGDGTAQSAAWLELNNMGNAQSTIELQGVVSYLSNGMNATAKVVLNNTTDGKSALKLYDGASGSVMTFSGNVEGSGTIERDMSGSGVSNMTFKFTGDVSKWDGGFLYTSARAAATPTTTVEFSGSATVVNASITRADDAPGTMKATFDNTGMTNGMTVNSAISGDVDVTYKGEDSRTTMVTGTDSNYSGTTTIESGKVQVNSGVSLGTGNVTVKGGSLALESGAVVRSTMIIKKGNATDAATVATIRGTESSAAGATFSGVTVTTTGLSGGALSNAAVTVSEDFSLSGVSVASSEFTVNDALSIGEGVTLDAASKLNIGSTGSVVAHGLVLSGEGHSLVVGGDGVKVSAGTVKTSQLKGISGSSTGTFSLNLDLTDQQWENLLGEGATNLLIEFTNLYTLASAPEAQGIALMAEGEPAAGTAQGLTFQLTDSAVQQLASHGYFVSTPTITVNVDGGGTTELSFNLGAVPEPSTVTLSLLALAGLAARRRRR